MEHSYYLFIRILLINNYISQLFSIISIKSTTGFIKHYTWCAGHSRVYNNNINDKNDFDYNVWLNKIYS